MRNEPVTILYTIGYQRKPLATFISQLREAGVDAVIDVRLRNTSHLAGYTKRDDLPSCCAMDSASPTNTTPNWPLLPRSSTPIEMTRTGQPTRPVSSRSWKSDPPKRRAAKSWPVTSRRACCALNRPRSIAIVAWWPNTGLRVCRS